MSDVACVSILTNQFVEPELAEKIVSDFRQSGLQVEHLRDESTKVFGFVELIIPTAVVVYIVGPFVKEISKNLANDSYNALKGLLKKTFGKDRPIQYEMQRRDGSVIPPTFSRDLSLSFKFDPDFSIIFLIRANLDEQAAVVSVTEAVKFVSDLAEDKHRFASARVFLAGQIGFFGTAYLIHEDGQFSFLDWPTSSQEKKVSVFSLPTD